jgi:hypothetical protein
MTVYVLGAGASKHAGYPLARSMGKDLLAWMRAQTTGLIWHYPAVADQIEETFSQFEDLDDLFEQMEVLVHNYENGTDKERMVRTLVANQQRPAAREAVREWFLEIRRNEQHGAYTDFARHIVQPGDCIVTFDYDVSLDRRLKEAGKWDVGDGYGFTVGGLPANSPTRLLKPHGSTNWLALMDGLPRSGAAQVSCVFASPRPAIGTRELDFLGYSGQRDPIFPGGQPALPAMIIGRNKRFSFDTGFGPEWGDFWRGLWEQAATALAHAERIVICGYSLPMVDEAAWNLMLKTPNKRAEIVILSGKRRTDEIVAEYARRGFTNARAACQVHFEQWVAQSIVEGSYGQRPTTNDHRPSANAVK